MCHAGRRFVRISRLCGNVPCGVGIRVERSVERLNERSLEDYLGWQRTTAIYIVDGWERWDCLGFNIFSSSTKKLINPERNRLYEQIIQALELAGPWVVQQPHALEDDDSNAAGEVVEKSDSL